MSLNQSLSLGSDAKLSSEDTVMTGEVVAVVILNWNGGEEVPNCLKSVFQSSHVGIEVVVVDNGSVDGSIDVIRQLFPRVHWISNPRNYGFAKGSNQGICWALERGIRYVLLLNADARLHPSAIEEMLAVTESEDDTVVACPRLYLGPTTAHPRRLWFAYGTVNLWLGLFQNPAFNHLDSPKWSSSRNMEFASGCCMLIPAQILRQIGMLDEAFFAYCEDIDFSLRVRAAGFCLRYVPTAHVWHVSNKLTNRARSKIYRYLSTRNNLWVVRKHGSRLELFACICILPCRSLFRIVNLLIRSDWHVITAELKGIKDGAFAEIKSPQASIL